MKKILICIFTAFLLVSCKTTPEQRAMESHKKMEQRIKKLRKNIVKDSITNELLKQLSLTTNTNFEDTEDLTLEYFDMLLENKKVTIKQYNAFLDLILDVAKQNKGVELSHILKYVTAQI